MVSRFTIQENEEQKRIQVQGEVARANSAIEDLKERIESLVSLGKMTENEGVDLLKQLKAVQDKIEKLMKKK